MKLINENKANNYYIVEKIRPNVISKSWYKTGIKLEDLGLTKDQIIVIALVGSKMYGTDTESSDDDYIGIYIPTIEQLLLNNVKHHIPLKTDTIDLQIWSIHHFLKLACKGETLAIDLLHAPSNNWLIYNLHVWPELTQNKNFFYTKNMKAFVGYARKQASVYGTKGNRIQAIENVIEFLKTINPIFHENKLYEYWNDLPAGEHIHFLNNETPFRMYQVCGRKFQETVTISYILNGLQKLLTSYGKRAKMAQNNEGIDHKALSHAIRAAEQVYWILKYGSYSYPLKNSDFIKKVKLGQINFEMAIAVLEDYMSEIERLMEKSNLPETINKKVVEKWLVNLLESYNL